MLWNSDEIGQLVTRFQIKNHVKGLPVVRYLLIESCQVEFVLNVIFINLKQDKNLLGGHKCGILHMALTSQKNSFPRNPQNQEIQDTSSELLIFLQIIKGEFRRLIITQLKLDYYVWTIRKVKCLIRQWTRSHRARPLAPTVNLWKAASNTRRLEASLRINLPLFPHEIF